jgi:exonuclease III
MLAVLFWNVNGQRHCEPLCANLVRAHAVDILVVAECQRPAKTLAAINATSPPISFRWVRTTSPCRVSIFTRFPRAELAELDSTRRYCVQALSGQNRLKLLLCFVHATSGVREAVEELEEEFRALALQLAEIEARQGHSRTLLLGDLNADPFERRVTDANYLHAVPTRTVAEEGSRVVKRKRYRYFYNPMWQFLGNQFPNPPGTFYWRKAVHNLRFWHVFDQALLRPDLLAYFADSDVTILLGDGTTVFHGAKGIPDRKVASDHFPVLVKLSYPGV